MSNHNTELANRKRDKRLRRRMLQLVAAARTSPRGGLNGRTLFDLVNETLPSDLGFEDESHALMLMRDLRDKGYLAEEMIERRRGQRFSVEFVFLRITAKGSSLLNETIPVDGDVDDERITEDF
jgi:hypothetical protein